MHHKTHKSSFWNTPSRGKDSQFFRHSCIVQAKQNSYAPPPQKEMETNAFAQNRFEEESLQLKETNGTITPAEKEGLGITRVQPEDLLSSSEDRDARKGIILAHIPLHSPDWPVSAHVQKTFPFGLSRARKTPPSGQLSSNTSRGESRYEQGIPTVQNPFDETNKAKSTIRQLVVKTKPKAYPVPHPDVERAQTGKRKKREQTVLRADQPGADEAPHTKARADRSSSNSDQCDDAELDIEIALAGGSGQSLPVHIRNRKQQTHESQTTQKGEQEAQVSARIHRYILASEKQTGLEGFFPTGERRGEAGKKEELADVTTQLMKKEKNTEEKENSERLTEEDIEIWLKEDEKNWSVLTREQRTQLHERKVPTKLAGRQTEAWQKALSTRQRGKSQVSWDFGEHRYHVNTQFAQFHVTCETSNPITHYFYTGYGTDIKDEQDENKARLINKEASKVFSDLPPDVQNFIRKNYRDLLF